ncbi:pimeloyl-ACP methyl ester carboxylesterase [Motilibacter peucedani]|uniref:Pimeloyl-ACP methyl ester carboxylesterase n=1 Tax=Motilibacter peucedani TaxID=598650 RepID=A0A420XSW8_9ACTN|nr:alpha/beta hydrolase [Motilibacter peucedani]RKS79923.1 pimeloyl-ACP methyl ester carboxylesterase [Motilibacter peucedani]
MLLTTPLRRRAAAITAAVLTTLTVTAGAASSHAAEAPKPTVVLVHGAWADGSSWAAVTRRLQKHGYTVDVVPDPLRGVKADADYLSRVLASIPGPIVLAAHSYGGMVATNAASGNSQVKALVYVDAYIPQQGDTVAGLSAGSALEDQSNLSAVPLDDTQTLYDLYIKQNLFPALFAAGAKPRDAAVLAAGQRPLLNAALGEPSPYQPAWASIPSWDVVGTADRIIPAVNQRSMAARAGAHVIEVNAPHLAMVTDPADVYHAIDAAAKATTG